MNINQLYEGRQVVLVDENDQELGIGDILQAHQGQGLKHRALSVVLYRKNEGGVELLLQKRSATKPVFAGLWSNTCCTNLLPGDTYIERAVSRLKEEMGITIVPHDLRSLYRFSYEAQDLQKPGWCENELDTVIVGEWDGAISLNPDEASDYRWENVARLREKIEKNPDEYSPWFALMMHDSRLNEGVRHD